MGLKLDWCSHEAAVFACRTWHYSKCTPIGKLIKIGAWEDDRFVGVIIFSRGATPHIGSPFGLKQTEICELTRVAMRDHTTPVSRMIAIALRMLKKLNEGLRCVVSFADLEQDHHGGIYQAGGWTYLGSTGEQRFFVVNGRRMHPKSVHQAGWVQSAEWLQKNVDPRAKNDIVPGKHKYAIGLDDAMRGVLLPLAKPYPKRARSIDVDAPGHQPGEGGSTPTRALRNSSK